MLGLSWQDPAGLLAEPLCAIYILGFVCIIYINYCIVTINSNLIIIDCAGNGSTWEHGEWYVFCRRSIRA